MGVFIILKDFFLPFKDHIWAFLVNYALWVEKEAFKHEIGCKDLIHVKNGRENFHPLLMFKILFLSNNRCGGLLSDGNISQKPSHFGVRSSLRQWILVYTDF